MLQPFQFLQNLSSRITSSTRGEAEFWKYAEPAGEEPDPLKRNVLQWRRLISSVREPLEVFPGQCLDVTGFVHRQLTDKDTQFTIARQVIRCCLADTMPLGLTVYTEQAAKFESGVWIRVRGKFAVQTIQEKPVLVIVPSKIRIIRQPQKLYINSVF
jgi:uncharacterized repeat protein (TIGR03943 family)